MRGRHEGGVTGWVFDTDDGSQEILCTCAEEHDCIMALAVIRFPSSDFATIQFLDCPFDEFGIIEAKTGTQDGHLFGRLTVKVAAYVLKPYPPARWLFRGHFRWRGGGRSDLVFGDIHVFQEALRRDF